MDPIAESIGSQSQLCEDAEVAERIPIRKDVSDNDIVPNSGNYDLPRLETLKIATPTSSGSEEIGKATEKDIQNHEKWYTVHPLLLDYDHCFFNWIPNNNPLTFNEADTILQVLTSRYENITGYPHLVDKYLKWCPVEFISQHLIIAFIHLIQSKLTEATTDLNKVVEIIKHAENDKFLSNDYIKGFNYLVTGLETLKKSLVLNSSIPGTEAAEATKDLEQFLAKCTKFNELSKPAQVLIKGARAKFVSSRKLHQEELNMIKDVLTYEPNSVEWLTNLIRISRTCRKAVNYRSGPSQEDKQNLLRAIELDEPHVMVKLNVCVYLCDIIKSRTWDPKTGAFKLDNFKEFSSIQEVVDFIKVKANEILHLVDSFSKTNVGIANIFGLRLPGKYRDVELAKKCLKYALKYNPWSSKANRLMGLLILTEDKNFDEAKKFIEEARACDPRDFPALIEVVHILLCKPNENAEELRKIFSEQIKPELWSPKILAELQYHQAIYLYIKGDKHAAVKSWILMYQTCPENIVSFKKLSYCIWRYQWNDRDVSITNVYEYLRKIKSRESCLSQVLDSQEFDIIDKLLEVVESAKIENETRFPSQYHGHMRGARPNFYGNGRNNRKQGSSYQGRGTYNRGPGSSASYSSGRWRRPNEGSLKEKDEHEDRNWRSNGTSQSDNQRKKSLEKKSENDTM